MTDQSFPKTARLLSQTDFDLVYRNKVFAADDVLVVTGRRNALGVTRLGLSVSRKVGNAVVRNRWKRAIREGFRRQRLEMPAQLDLVVRPKKGALCDSARIHRSLARLATRIDKSLNRGQPRL